MVLTVGQLRKSSASEYSLSHAALVLLNRGEKLARMLIGLALRRSGPPHRDFYRHYDDALRDSSKREPLEFFNEVLRRDLSLLSFLNTDFLVINERRAKHYGIAGVEGENFRRVPAPADDRRGGVLGMAGIHTYLADGTRTLPVRRASWVLDTLWNRPVPNPPPNAGDLPAMNRPIIYFLPITS